MPGFFTFAAPKSASKPVKAQLPDRLRGAAYFPVMRFRPGVHISHAATQPRRPVPLFGSIARYARHCLGGTYE